MSASIFDLAGRVAAVTGAGRGIGRGLALGLARFEADVVVTELEPRLGEAAETAAEIEALGRRALALALDVRDISGIEQAMAQASWHFGRLDILVNNAGVQVAKPAFEVTEADWDAVVDVNLKGVFFCAQAAGRIMRQQGGGKIVNIASQNGVIGYYNRAAYCAAKAGVVNLTRVLALEWAPHRINVNAIGPTFIRTALAEQTLKDPEARDEILSRIPLGRIGEVDDLVGATVFLASSASDLVTGHTLLVDGGWTAI